MVDIVNYKFDNRKKIFYELQSVFGIGKARARSLCLLVGLSLDIRVYQVSDEKLWIIYKYISANYVTGWLLKREITYDIQLKKIIKCYKGLRHEMNLPVRGQRTRSNSKTVRRLSKKILWGAGSKVRNQVNKKNG